MANLNNFIELRRESDTEFTFTYDTVDLVVEAHVDTRIEKGGDGWNYPYYEDIEVRDIDFGDITLITENSTAKVKPSDALLNQLADAISDLVESDSTIFRPKRKTA